METTKKKLLLKKDTVKVLEIKSNIKAGTGFTDRCNLPGSLGYSSYRK